MTSGPPTLTFDEGRLRGRLARLPFAHQALFVASCCERAAPTCVDYAEDVSLADEAELVRQLTETAWRGALDPKQRLGDRGVANELWRFARMEPDPNEPLRIYVVDCASALYFGADFFLSESLESASEAARWTYNALDALVANRSGSSSGSAEDSRRLNADRTIQRELRKQDSDLATVESTLHPDAALAQRLRAESARLGQIMLSEFEAEAQNRLGRGSR